MQIVIKAMYSLSIKNLKNFRLITQQIRRFTRGEDLGSRICNPNDARQRIGVPRNEEGRDRNICLSLRAGTNMRRRDEEAARDVGAMRINGWNVGLSFVRLSVPKSIAAFRSARSRYYCYDRVSEFLQECRPETRGTRDRGGDPRF